VTGAPDVVEPGEPCAQRKPREPRRKRDERGFIAVWFALLIFVLLGISALVVDIARGYVVGQDAQNAVDAAALGGVVFLPSNPTGATTRALKVASENGYTNDSSTNITAVPKLKVDLSRTVKTWFGGAIGFKTLTVHRSATADYDQPVRMGSPANTFGNLPDCTSGQCGNSAQVEAPHFWFNIAGKDSKKGQGDGFASGRCDQDNADNCPNGGTNLDYDPDGYSYVVHNDVANQNVDIQVFDPGLVHVGDHCENTALDALVTAAGATNAARYAKGDGPYCTGDIEWDYGDGTGYGTPVTTTYSVYYDPGTPWNTADDDPQPGCTRVITGIGPGANLAQLWQNGDVRMTQYFRRWVSLCSVNKKGDYLLYISTDTGRGHNRGALRAVANGVNTNTGVQIYANGKMAIYQNELGTNTIFYLARVLPGAAGRTLKLSFYDTGDASSPGTLKVQPPADATIVSGATSSALTSFSGCTYTAPPGNATGPPWGTYSATNSDCSVNNVSSSTGWNGQWIQWDVPIPENYQCNVNDPTGCWVTINFNYPSAASDTSTWMAKLDGNPVRIVK
jgi:Flp pilus assembly protein TadG